MKFVINNLFFFFTFLLIAASTTPNGGNYTLQATEERISRSFFEITYQSSNMHQVYIMKLDKDLLYIFLHCFAKVMCS